MATTRTLVLVAGSGRSGTSLFAGILQRLGAVVPQPEVPADESNPRGFAESQWVVDFHTRLLAGAGVQVADARPEAWATTARSGLDPEVRAELRGWLDAAFGEHGTLVVKDPRLSWFLPLWRHCAGDVGAEARFVTMLRHPAAVVDSKQRWYGGRQGEVGRAAGWLNQTLFTERATRGGSRAFLGYDDLLADWTQAVGRVGDALDLDVVRHASPAAMRAVHAFVDRDLSRSRTDWGESPVPDALQAQADTVWGLVSRLAGGAEEAVVAAELDDARAAYLRLYADAEAIAQSSVAAAARGGAARAPALPPSARWLRRHVPARYRAKVPARVRVGIVRRLRSAPL